MIGVLMLVMQCVTCLLDYKKLMTRQSAPQSVADNEYRIL
jgi:hypothetical protein